MIAEGGGALSLGGAGAAKNTVHHVTAPPTAVPTAIRLPTTAVDALAIFVTRSDFVSVREGSAAGLSPVILRSLNGVT